MGITERRKGDMVRGEEKVKRMKLVWAKGFTERDIGREREREIKAGN